jgi:hypothetical protein
LETTEREPALEVETALGGAEQSCTLLVAAFKPVLLGEAVAEVAPEGHPVYVPVLIDGSAQELFDHPLRGTPLHPMEEERLEQWNKEAALGETLHRFVSKQVG